MKLAEFSASIFSCRVGVVAAAAALAIVGCRVDQNREIAKYRNVLNGTVAATTAPSADEPLTLERAMQLANQNNEQLGLNGEAYVQALINKNRLVSSFLPSVSLNPSYLIAQKPNGVSSTSGTATNTGGGTGSTGGGTGTGATGSGSGGSSSVNTGYRVHGDTIQQTQVPVVGSINLYRGGADIANLDALDAIIAQRRDLLLDLQQTVLLNVAQTYYQVLRSEQSIRVLENSLQLQQARLADVRQQRLNGLATNLAVAQTRAEVDATRVSLIRAQTDRVNARSMLAELVGVHNVNNPLVDNFAIPADFSPIDEYERQALDQRLDVKAAREAVFAARKGVDVAFSQYYPSVSLDVTGFLYREDYGNASKWNALLAASLPIFSAGQIEADVLTAWSALRQSALNESQTRRFALRDVQQAFQNVIGTRNTIRELTDEVAAAQEAYNQSRDAYRNGLAINLDVVTSQDQLLNSELQLASARYDEVVYFLDLRRAVGVLPLQLSTPIPATQPGVATAQTAQ